MKIKPKLKMENQKKNDTKKIPFHEKIGPKKKKTG